MLSPPRSSPSRGAAGGGRSGDPRAELLPAGGRRGLQALEGGGAAWREAPAFREDERKAHPGPAGSHLGTAAPAPLSVCLPARDVVWGFQAPCQWPRGSQAEAKQEGPSPRLDPKGLGSPPLPGGDPSVEPRAPFWHLPALRLRTGAPWLIPTRGLQAVAPGRCPHP